MGETESGIWVPPGGSADPRREQPLPGEPSAEQPTPEEIAEQLRRLRASDLVVSILPTLAQVAYAKLDPASRDLDEARVAIDSIRALLPVLEASRGAELTRDFQQVVTNLQLAYATAADEAAKEQPAGDG